METKCKIKKTRTVITVWDEHPPLRAIRWRPFEKWTIESTPDNLLKALTEVKSVLGKIEAGRMCKYDPHGFRPMLPDGDKCARCALEEFLGFDI